METDSSETVPSLEELLEERIKLNEEMDKNIDILMKDKYSNNDINIIKNLEIKFDEHFNRQRAKRLKPKCIDSTNNSLCEYNNCKLDECCICYDDTNNFTMKTSCNHSICLECILKLKTTTCPMCRQEFPKEIKELLSDRVQQNNQPVGIDSNFDWNGIRESFIS